MGTSFHFLASSRLKFHHLVAILVVSIALVCTCNVNIAYAISPGTVLARSEAKTATIAEKARVELNAYGNFKTKGGNTYVDWNYGSRGEAWCVDFVSYCANEAGLIYHGRYPDPKIRLNGDISTCNVSGLRNWLTKNGSVSYANDGTYVPVIGDLVLRGGEHIGIVSKVGKNCFYTIEGNTGSGGNSKSTILEKGPWYYGDTKSWTDFVNIKYKRGNNKALNIQNAVITGGPKNGKVIVTGSELKPSYTLKMGGRVLSTGKYTTWYSKNIYPGTANVTFHAIQETTTGGTVLSKGYFDIVPKTSFKIIGPANSWKKLKKNWYYFNKDGIHTVGWLTLKGKKYYFNLDGHMQTGWQTIAKKQYYFKGGDSGQMLTGWQKLTGKGSKLQHWYYFGSDGVMRTGLQTINGKKYYFANAGCMMTGWQHITANGKTGRCYFKGGDSGQMLTGGWYKINIGNNNPTKRWFYFGTDGFPYIGLHKIKGNLYYFSNGTETDYSGMMLTGWKTIDKKSYYFEGGDSGKAVTGVRQIGDKVHYFDKNGVWCGSRYA